MRLTWIASILTVLGIITASDSLFTGLLPIESSGSITVSATMIDHTKITPDPNNEALIVNGNILATGSISGVAVNATDDITVYTDYIKLYSTGAAEFAQGAVTIGTDAKITTDGDVQTATNSAFYFGDMDTDGSWRIVRSGNNLVFERRESSSWVTKQTMTP